MVRVLYLTANGFPASSTDARGTFSLEHAQALRSAGLEVDAVDMSRDAFSADVIAGLPVTRIPRLRPLLRSGRIGEVVRYLQFFRRRKADSYDAVILSFFYLKYLPLILYLRAKSRVILVIAHGGEVMPGGVFRGLLKRWMFRAVDIVMPVSDFTEAIFSCLVGRRRSDDSRIIKIYNGVDATKLMPHVPCEAMRRRLGISESKFVILSVCNLVKRKGVDILINAVRLLAEEGREIHHVIIGRGPERCRLEQLADSAGSCARFTFLDAVDAGELGDFYEMADVFALVSVTDWGAGQVEGFGITYAEAMALGTPVIGGGGSGTTTPIKHGFTGILVDPHRPDVVEQVAAGIRKYMDDRPFYLRVSQDARRWVEGQFSWAENAERTKAAIETALSWRERDTRAIRHADSRSS